MITFFVDPKLLFLLIDSLAIKMDRGGDCEPENTHSTDLGAAAAKLLQSCPTV